MQGCGKESFLVEMNCVDNNGWKYTNHDYFVGLSQQYEALSLPVIMQPKDGTLRQSLVVGVNCLVRLTCTCKTMKVQFPQPYQCLGN